MREIVCDHIRHWWSGACHANRGAESHNDHRNDSVAKGTEFAAKKAANYSLDRRRPFIVFRLGKSFSMSLRDAKMLGPMATSDMIVTVQAAAGETLLLGGKHR
jgi:hypothetical protein